MKNNRDHYKKQAKTISKTIDLATSPLKIDRFELLRILSAVFFDGGCNGDTPEGKFLQKTKFLTVFLNPEDSIVEKTAGTNTNSGTNSANKSGKQILGTNPRNNVKR